LDTNKKQNIYQDKFHGTKITFKML
jgi:hypothetical protein